MVEPLFIQGGNSAPLVRCLARDLVCDEIGSNFDIGMQPIAQSGGILNIQVEGLPANTSVAHVQADASIPHPFSLCRSCP